MRIHNLLMATLVVFFTSGLMLTSFQAQAGEHGVGRSSNARGTDRSDATFDNMQKEIYKSHYCCKHHHKHHHHHHHHHKHHTDKTVQK